MYTQKSRLKINLISKASLLLIAGFSVKLFFSCTPESYDPKEVHYNAAKVIGIDNSGEYLYEYEDIDTMYSDAIAFKLTMRSAELDYLGWLVNNISKSLSYTSLKAEAPNITYIPVNKITRIQVKTLFDIDDNIRAGDDISEHIMFVPDYGSFLYQHLNKAIEKLNGIQSEYDFGNIELILKGTVENSQAQFEFTVTLDSGEELTCNTELFTILQR